MKLLILLRTAVLRRRLRVNGYTGFTVFQAEALYLLLGRRSWRIPPLEELGAIPGVDPANVDSIVQVMRQRGWTASPDPTNTREIAK